MANILSIIPFHIIPPRSGGQNGIAGFTDFLARKHNVVVVSTNLNAKENPFPFKLINLFGGTRWRYLNFFHAISLIKICRENKIQFIISEHSFMAYFAFAVSKFVGIPFYIHNHNIEFERHRTIGKWWWRLMKVYEGWSMRAANALFFKTSLDRDLAMESFNLSPSKCYVVPYGIYYSEIPLVKADVRQVVNERHQVNPDEKILLFFGVLSYQPNYEALDIILNHINPLLLEQHDFKYKILICGKGLPDRFNNLTDYVQQNIIHVGFVDDIDEYINASDVILNPVLTGGGIKTKVVEGLAFNKNIVSTYSGAVGIDEKNCNGKLLICKDHDWPAFALNIKKSFELKNDTPQVFFDHFYWGSIVNSLDSLFDSDTK